MTRHGALSCTGATAVDTPPKSSRVLTSPVRIEPPPKPSRSLTMPTTTGRSPKPSRSRPSGSRCARSLRSRACFLRAGRERSPFESARTACPSVGRCGPRPPQPPALLARVARCDARPSRVYGARPPARPPARARWTDGDGRLSAIHGPGAPERMLPRACASANHDPGGIEGRAGSTRPRRRKDRRSERSERPRTAASRGWLSA